MTKDKIDPIRLTIAAADDIEAVVERITWVLARGGSRGLKESGRNPDTLTQDQAIEDLSKAGVDLDDLANLRLARGILGMFSDDLVQ